MFKITDIKELIRAIDRSSITELTIRGEKKEQLTIKKGSTDGNSAPVQNAVIAPHVEERSVEVQATAPKPVEAIEPKQEVPSSTEQYHAIVSPMVGTFYVAPSPDSDPYVQVGDKVKPDTIVCIVEAMKLMNELESEVSGEIVEVLVENGQLVEYGQPLFHVKLS